VPPRQRGKGEIVAGYGTVGSGVRIFVLILLILVLLLGGFVWFDYLGIMDAKETLRPVLSLVGLGAPTPIEDTESATLLDDERFSKREEALLLREEDLDKREELVVQKEAEVQQKVESLAEREKGLEEQEKSFNERVKEYDNKNANIRQAALYYTNMPPKDAVARLEKMQDQDVIDILRMIQRIADEQKTDSVVAYYLSLFPADRAAELNRKMIKKPEE
jgi:flagellar protein FlbB